MVLNQLIWICCSKHGSIWSMVWMSRRSLMDTYEIFVKDEHFGICSKPSLDVCIQSGFSKPFDTLGFPISRSVELDSTGVTTLRGWPLITDRNCTDDFRTSCSFSGAVSSFLGPRTWKLFQKQAFQRIKQRRQSFLGHSSFMSRSQCEVYAASQ